MFEVFVFNMNMLLLVGYFRIVGLVIVFLREINVVFFFLF